MRLIVGLCILASNTSVWAYPSYVACADDAKTSVKLGTTMMNVAITKSSGVTMTAKRDATPVTKHRPGELLTVQISGFPSNAAVLVRSDDAANATLTSDDAPNTVCPSMVTTKDGVTLSGSMTVSIRPGCTNSTKPIKVQFVSCIKNGQPVELTELTLIPETNSSGMVQEDPSCFGAPIPTPPPAAGNSQTYTALVWVHRWGVILTWGFLFPLGVALVRYQGGSRIKSHRYIQSFGLIVEMIQLGCIIAAHEVGPTGNGPVQGDTNFGPDIGSAPTVTHKQRGLAIDICVLLQLFLGVMRPTPYPNDFKRRMWMWAHRLIGDGAMVVAWINLWEAMPSVEDDSATFYSMVIVAGLLWVTTVLVTPMYLMMKASRAEATLDLTGSPASIADGGAVVSLTTAQNLDAPNFFACGHCDQVFTQRRILEVHHRFTHMDKEYKEVLTPMPKRFAEVINTPAVNEGVPLSVVMTHKTKHDCWVVINGQVYDLTNFLSRHPGGPNPILSYAGRDASKAWNLVHRPSFIQEYASMIECLGPLAPEPPVAGASETGSFKGSFKSGRQDAEQPSVLTSTAASTALLRSAV